MCSILPRPISACAQELFDQNGKGKMKSQDGKNNPGEKSLSKEEKVLKVTFFVGAFILAALTVEVTSTFEMEKWQMSLGLLLLAGILHFMDVFLERFFTKRFFIKARGPGFTNAGHSGLTSPHVIAPKWVSVIGVLSASALITALLTWIMTLFTWAF